MRTALLIGVLATPLGCGTHSEERMCTAEVKSAIVQGDSSAELLRADAEELRAVVEVVLDQPPAICSGVLVAPGWVATANHCAEAAGITGVRIDDGIVPAVALHAHPDLDVLLIELPPGSTTATPIALDDESVGQALAGRPAQIAGYGVGSPQDGPGFLAVTIDGIDEHRIAVNAGGRGGACLGDSGGPLLVRGPDGSVRVLGVLGEGSATCRGEDYYTRLDLARPFIEALTGALDAGTPPCGDLGREGRCFGGRAVWCEDGMARAADCSGATACGWDTDARGFRCVDPSLDPCAGIDDLGRCDAAGATRCEAGKLVTTVCDSCGQTCVISASSGQAGCNG